MFLPVIKKLVSEAAEKKNWFFCVQKISSKKLIRTKKIWSQ